MIVRPSRSVTRFFIPMIDVLTLLFCIYLLMPMVGASGEGESEADRRVREEQIRRLEAEHARRGLAGDVDPDKFMPWINNLTQQEGPNILRCKGIVAFSGDPKRFVFQGVHMMLDGEPQRDWKSGEPRESKVVFIGRDLKADQIREGFLACAA